MLEPSGEQNDGIRIVGSVTTFPMLGEILRDFAGGLVAAVLLTPMCRILARRIGVVASPAGDRWHQKATPLLGGLAIVVPVLVATPFLHPDARMWHVAACGALAAVFGVSDDIISLKPSTKLIIQILIASLLLFWGYRLQWVTSQILDSMLTLFWIVGITNAFNLLDNMDGLCAGTALIAGVFALAGGSSVEIDSVVRYIAILTGATGGFLFYNWHPASIFMGDAGSLFLGLNLAMLPLVARSEVRNKLGLLWVVLSPVLLLSLPILDTTFVTVLRLLSGRRPSQGGRDHTSHRLVAIGLSQRSAVGVLWTLAATGGAIALLFRSGRTSWGLISASAFGLGVLIFAAYLARVRVYGADDLRRLRGQRLTPLVVDVMYKKRVVEVMLDLCLVTLAYYTAYRLRFEGSDFYTNYAHFIRSLPLVIAAQLTALFVFGGYRGSWQLFGMMDAVTFGRAVVGGTLGAQLLVLYIDRFEHYSSSVFVIYAALLMLLLLGTRASFRLIGEYVLRRRKGERCVVYGLATASLTTIREAFGDNLPRIIGFVDDDPDRRRSRVSGYHVLGTSDKLLAMIERGEIDCVVLNTRLPENEPLVAIERACSIHHVRLLRLNVGFTPMSA